jgi:hypothetical protein
MTAAASERVVYSGAAHAILNSSCRWRGATRIEPHKGYGRSRGFEQEQWASTFGGYHFYNSGPPAETD